MVEVGFGSVDLFEDRGAALGIGLFASGECCRHVAFHPAGGPDAGAFANELAKVAEFVGADGVVAAFVFEQLFERLLGGGCRCGAGGLHRVLVIAGGIAK